MTDRDRVRTVVPRLWSSASAAEAVGPAGQQVLRRDCRVCPEPGKQPVVRRTRTSSSRRDTRTPWRGLLVVAVLLVTSAALPAGAAVGSSCQGRPATIVGTDSSDRLVGTPGLDVIVGGDGDDRLEGLGGDDLLCGGPGRDLLVGGAGDDVLRGGEGDDSRVLTGQEADLASRVRVSFVGGLHGGEGNDVLVDEGGVANTLDGGPGHDRLTATSGRNTLLGGPGDDVIVGGAGDEDIDAGHGDDVVRAGGGSAIVQAGSGKDRVDLAGGYDVARTGAGDDRITDFDGARMDAGAGDDLVVATVNQDDGHENPVQIDGGSGNDTITISGRTGVIVLGSDGADAFATASGRDRLDGGAGDDVLSAGPGDDTVDGGVGEERADGGGADRCAAEERAACEQP